MVPLVPAAHEHEDASHNAKGLRRENRWVYKGSGYPARSVICKRCSYLIWRAD